MKEEHYIISDAAKMLSLEPHVLRYWEEELQLTINRNDMGHRFYTSTDLSIFEGVKYLKEYGFHLRAIKFLLPELDRIKTFSKQQLMELKYEMECNASSDRLPKVASTQPESSDERMIQFKKIITSIVTDAIQASEKNISSQVSNHVSKEIDYLLRQKEEADEQRFRTLDETIRTYQKARSESATSLTQTHEKKGKIKNFLCRKTIAF